MEEWDTVSNGQRTEGMGCRHDTPRIEKVQGLGKIRIFSPGGEGDVYSLV